MFPFHKHEWLSYVSPYVSITITTVKFCLYISKCMIQVNELGILNLVASKSQVCPWLNWVVM